MANFPFNNDKYNDENNDEANGSPISIYDARRWADTILYWHTNNNTSNFSQSSDGFDTDVNALAWGLLELLSDPNAIRRIITTGEQVMEDVKLVLNFPKDYENLHMKNVLKALDETTFKKEDDN